MKNGTPTPIFHFYWQSQLDNITIIRIFIFSVRNERWKKWKIDFSNFHFLTYLGSMEFRLPGSVCWRFLPRHACLVTKLLKLESRSFALWSSAIPQLIARKVWRRNSMRFRRKKGSFKSVKLGWGGYRQRGDFAMLYILETGWGWHSRLITEKQL